MAWVTGEPVSEPGPVWSALTALHGQTGLVPILLSPDGGDYLEPSRGDTVAVADVDRVDAAVILEHRWADCFPEPWQVGSDGDEDW